MNCALPAFATIGRTARLSLSIATLFLVIFGGPVSAQIVRGLVVDSISGIPLVGGTVVLEHEDGREVARTRTDTEGLFLLRAGDQGTFRLRAEHQGYRTSVFPPFDLAAEQMVAYQLLVAPLDVAAATPPVDPEDEIISEVCTTLPPGLPLLMGLVQREGEPVAQANVTLTWSALTGALQSQAAGLDDAEGSAVSGSTGFYAVCGAPVGVPVVIFAEHQGALTPLHTIQFDSAVVYVDGQPSPMDGRLWRLDLDLLPAAERTASIVGFVTDTLGNRVANATVRVPGTRLTNRANMFGEFRLERLPPGLYRLRAEMVGYRPSTTEVALASGERLELDESLTITPAPTELRPITVEADRPETRRDLTEFFRRRETTTGQFITREEFEQQGNVRTTTDILRRMRGLRVTPGLGNLEWFITTNRGGGRSGTGTCYPLVYMDRQYMGTTGQVNIDQIIPLVNIEALEVYVSTAGLPLEFNRPGAVCGVLHFWTR